MKREFYRAVRVPLPMRVIRYLWALPATCVGATLGLLALARGGRVRVVGGAIEVAGAVPAAPGFAAITLGHVIIGRSEACLDACRAHEHVHVRQYERWGVLLFALYLASSAWSWLRGRHPYYDNVFEREAFRLTPPRGDA